MVDFLFEKWCGIAPGFDMSPMKPTKFEDGIIEIVNASEVMTSECLLTVGSPSIILPSKLFPTANVNSGRVAGHQHQQCQGSRTRL